MISVVLVEPEYAINVGMTARVMKNLGVERLILVNPKCEIGFVAKMFAKGGEDVIEKAEVVKSLEEVKADYFVATTGVVKRYTTTHRSVMPLKGFVEEWWGKIRSSRVALLFGRESKGLNKEELNKGDFIITIEANPSYPVFNLSNAVAIVLYELISSSPPQPYIHEKIAGRRYLGALERNFSLLAEKFSLRNREKVVMTWKRVLRRAMLTEREAKALLKVIRLAAEEGGSLKNISEKN